VVERPLTIGLPGAFLPISRRSRRQSGAMEARPTRWSSYNGVVCRGLILALSAFAAFSRLGWAVVFGGVR
jgi:hypothetical protein